MNPSPPDPRTRPKLCRIEAAAGSSRATLTPPPPPPVFTAIYCACRARGWPLPLVRFYPSGRGAEVTVVGPTPQELADALTAEPAFDYAVTVG